MASTSSAHHSLRAQYDVNKPIKIESTVAKVERMSPHVYFYLDVETEGRVANYGVENGAPPRERPSCFGFLGPIYRGFSDGEQIAALWVTNLCAMPSKSRNTSGLTRDRRTRTAS